MLGGCAALPDADTFIDRYRLQPNIGSLHELIANGRIAGWVYGAVHYGTFERPSLSPAAARAIAQTRHVYLEQTDRAGTSWPMRMAVAEDLEGIARAKRSAAVASAERVRKALVAARKLETQTGGVAALLANDPTYYEGWALAYNYCGVFYEYGTERLVRVLAAGSDITIHSLETEASRQAALEHSRSDRCRQASHAANPSGVPDTMEAACTLMLHDLDRDQREGRPASLTPVAACVLDSRHRTMAGRIAEAVGRGEKPFVIVGRGHVTPEQNLIALLEAQGLALRRID